MFFSTPMDCDSWSRLWSCVMGTGNAVDGQETCAPGAALGRQADSVAPVTPVTSYAMVPAPSAVLPRANFCTQLPHLLSDDLVLLSEHLPRRWAGRAGRAGRRDRLSAHGAG